MPPKRALLCLLPTLLAAAASATAQDPASDATSVREESRVTVATATKSWAALGLRGGDVVVYDLVGGRRFQWRSPTSSIRHLALDPMGIAAAPRPPEEAEGPGSAAPVPVVLLAAADGSGKKTQLFVLKGDDGLLLTEIRIPGPPVGLLVVPGRGLAYVFTGTAEQEPDSRRAGRWTLRAVDVTAGKVEAALSLTGTVHGVALSRDGSRIYVGLVDIIRSFTTEPLRSSWMLRSPGRNRILREAGPLGTLLSVRDSQLAILDPDRLPGRNPETGEAPDDDAVAAVELPFIGRFMDVNEGTGEAIVLDARGARMATVDLEAGQVSQVQVVPDVAAAAYHPERDSLLLFEQFADRVFEMLHNPPDRSTGGESAAAAPAAPPAAGPTGPAAGDRTGAEPSAPAPPAREAQARDPAGDRTAPGDGARTGGTPDATGPADGPGDDSGSPPAEAAPGGKAGMDAAPPAPPEPAPEPPAPAAGEPATTAPGEPLSGRVSGDLDLVSAVVFFGPDAILREYARIHPGSDGTFTLPEPPPGRYRVVLEGVEGAQLRCLPPLRQIQVGEKAVEALDFQVSGLIRARISPR